MLNRVCLQGRFTHEPEVRLTSSQTPYCGFRLAVTRDFRNADGSYATDFIDCVAWRNTANFITKYFHKGDMIVLDGRLQVDNFKDSEGNNRSKVTVQVDGANFGGDAARSTTQQQSVEPAPEIEQSTSTDTEDNGLPFEV